MKMIITNGVTSYFYKGMQFHSLSDVMKHARNNNTQAKFKRHLNNLKFMAAFAKNNPPTRQDMR